MSAAYIIRKSPNAKYFFILRAGNNEPILASEMYESKQGAKTGIASVRTNSPHDSRYERKAAKNGSQYFTLKATNGQVLGTSEMYPSAVSRELGIASVKTNGPKAPVIDDTGE